MKLTVAKARTLGSNCRHSWPGVFGPDKVVDHPHSAAVSLWMAPQVQDTQSRPAFKKVR